MTLNTNPILQIHPTRRCNLRCLHCYSASSPNEKDQLDVALLRQAITDASMEGYKTVSFSGGEPILYQPLLELLNHAHQCKMNTAIASNGILINEQTIEKFKGVLDILAISLDGMPDFHNQMRGNKQAFEMMNGRLEGIRQSGIPFGFIFTISHENFRHLDWVANFALEQGASLLQIHPLEAVGRAKQNLAGMTPSASISAYVYLEVMKLRKKLGDQLYVQIDLVHQEALRLNPSSFFVDSISKDQANFSLAEIVSPLIIEADGMLVPVQHGFARKYALGNLKEASLTELAHQWYREKSCDFIKLCQQVYEKETIPTEFPVINWHEAMVRHAGKFDIPVLAS